MNISTHILMFLIGLVYPACLMLTYKKANHRLKTEEDYRLGYYKVLIFVFWLLTVLVVGNTYIDNVLKLNFYPTYHTTGIVLVVLVLLFIAVQWATSKISTKEKAEPVINKFKDFYHFLPNSKPEYIWFNLLSISAGICEEIIFRLFMFSYFLALTNLPAVFVLTNVIFALTHFDTSKQNMLNSFLLGLLLSGIYYLSGNIWLPIILHISIDINLGYMNRQANNFRNTITTK